MSYGEATGYPAVKGHLVANTGPVIALASLDHLDIPHTLKQARLSDGSLVS
jgi:hypothetical protein